MSTKKDKVVEAPQEINEAAEPTVEVTVEESATAQEEPAKNTLDNRSAREVLKDYLSDPKVKDNLLSWAKYFEERFHGNWFDMMQVLKKTPLKSAGNATGVLDMLVLANLMHREVRNKVLKFKITLDPNDKIRLLKAEIVALDQQREAIQRQIDTLETKAAS